MASVGCKVYDTLTGCVASGTCKTYSRETKLSLANFHRLPIICSRSPPLKKGVSLEASNLQMN
jgi:hypothetical protein